MIEKVKSFLRGATPPARLAEIEAAITAAEAERAQHVARRPGEVVAKLTGDPDAAGRVEAIDQAVAALDARLHDLRDAAGELRRRIAADQVAARQREAEARPKRIAVKRREYLAAVERFTEHAAAMAAEEQAIAELAGELATELGDQTTRRFLSSCALAKRLQSGVARLFAIDPARSLTASNSLFGIASYEVGERSHWTPLDHELAGLDDLVPFFDRPAEAEAARDRLARGAAARRQGARDRLSQRDGRRETINGALTIENAAAVERLAAPIATMVVVPLPGGCFTLIAEHQVFGDRAAADQAATAAAARGRPQAVVGHDGGFVLVPERFAWEAA